MKKDYILSSQSYAALQYTIAFIIKHKNQTTDLYDLDKSLNDNQPILENIIAEHLQ